MFIERIWKTKPNQQNAEQTEATFTELPALEYKPLHEAHEGAFSCGENEIDRWYKKKARDEHKKFNSRVTVASFENSSEPVAIYALTVRLENEKGLTVNDKKKWNDYRKVNNLFICLNLDYLAVSRKYQRRGVGRIVMGRVLEEFATVAQTSSIQLLTGRAIDADIFKFYQQLGFQVYGSDARQPFMHLPVQSVLALIQQEGQ